MRPGDPTFIRPIKQGKDGPLFRAGDLREWLASEANVGTPVTRRSKTVATDFEAAAKVMAQANEMFNTELAKLNRTQEALVASTRATSTNVRKAANEIHEGLQRVEKAANFDRLERQVAVLERAAAALKTLAELEQSGKLARLISAVAP